MPSSIAARTSLKPGSETRGVPASLTRAMRAPAFNFSTSLGRSVPRYDRYRASAVWDAMDGKQLGGDAGIFGGDQVHPRQTSSARRLISLAWPMGVAVR